MKKFFIALLICGTTLFSGCDSAQTTETGTTSDATVTTGITTTAKSATSSTAPELEVEGLEIIFDDKWVHVNIPADYTDENIGEYFRETEWVVYVPHEDSMFCVENGALYSKDMTKLYAVPSWCEDEETKDLPGPQKAFTVPESVTWIAPNAFHMITSERPLINLFLHDGITEENRKELVLWGGTFVIRK